jgi:DNA polymerase-3 subunit delta'
LEQAHPDFITVEDPDHKRIPVDMVRRIREDMFILPNESDHKIYLFPQELGIEGQNALLKVLEEPPSYGVFILLTENSEKILPTVRSRCRELKLQALPSDLLRSALLREFPKADPADLDAAILRSGGYLGQAKQFLQEGAALPKEAQALLQAFAARDSLALVQTLAPMEKWKRDALTDTLSTSLELMESALALGMGGISATAAARELANRRSSQDIYSAIIALKKALVYLQGNISPAAVCGWLTWQLR